MREPIEYDARARIGERRRRRSAGLAVVGLAAVALVAAGLGGRLLGPTRPSPAVPSTPGTVAPSTPATADLRPVDSFAFGPGDLLELGDAVTASDLGVPLRIARGEHVLVVSTEVRRGVATYQLQVTGPGAAEDGAEDRMVTIDASTLDGHAGAARPDCPSDDPPLEAVAPLAPFERLACYGSRPIALRGVVVSVGAPFGPFELESAGPVPVRLPVGAVAPELAPVEDARFVDVVGHFDDPDAVACPSSLPDTLVRCRERFVVTGLAAAPAPADVVAGAWRALPPVPGAARYAAAVALSPRRIVVSGGLPAVDTPDPSLPTVSLDAGSTEWRRLPPPPGERRWGAAALVVGPRTFLFGGSTTETFRATHTAVVLDGTGRWTSLPAAPFAFQQSTAAVVAGDGSVVVVSASDTPSGLDEGPTPPLDLLAARLDATTGRWTRLPSIHDVIDGFGLYDVGGRPEVVATTIDGATEVRALVDGAWRSIAIPHGTDLEAVSGTATTEALVLVGARTSVPDSEAVAVSLPRSGEPSVWPLPGEPYGGGSAAGRSVILGPSVGRLIALDAATGAWRPLQPVPAAIGPSSTGVWTRDRLRVIAERTDDTGGLAFAEFVPDDASPFEDSHRAAR